MKGSSRSHHQGYSNPGPTSGGYLPPISTEESASEGGSRDVDVCAERCGGGEKQQSKDPFFIGFKSAWQFLESTLDGILITPPPPASPPLPQLSCTRLTSLCRAFVTDHPAPIYPDYWLSSIMDCAEGQEGLIPMILSPLLACAGDWTQVGI